MFMYSMCFILFLTGLYCVVIKKNLLKIAIGIAIMEFAVNLFIVMIGYRWDAHTPIAQANSPSWNYVDPLSQAMALLSIVIGLATLITFVSISMRLYEKYGTFDITEIRKLRG